MARKHRPRPTEDQLGYGARYKYERERWRPIVDAGQALCIRCAEPIEAGSKWDLDHADDRSAIAGPAHRYCNRAAGGRRGAEETNRVKGNMIATRAWGQVEPDFLPPA